MVAMEGQLVAVEVTAASTAERAAVVAREACRAVAAAEVGWMALEASEVHLAGTAGWAVKTVGLEARAEALEAARAVNAAARPRRAAAKKALFTDVRRASRPCVLRKCLRTFPFLFLTCKVHIQYLSFFRNEYFMNAPSTNYHDIFSNVINGHETKVRPHTQLRPNSLDSNKHHRPQGAPRCLSVSSCVSSRKVVVSTRQHPPLVSVRVRHIEEKATFWHAGTHDGGPKAEQ